ALICSISNRIWRSMCFFAKRFSFARWTSSGSIMAIAFMTDSVGLEENNKSDLSRQIFLRKSVPTDCSGMSFRGVHLPAMEFPICTRSKDLSIWGFLKKLLGEEEMNGFESTHSNCFFHTHN